MNVLMKLNLQSKLALKSLLNAPAFVSSVLVTMSLTLATLFVVLSLINTYFIKPLNVLDENKLFVIEQEVDTPVGTNAGYQSYKAMIHWYKTQQSFEKLAIVNPARLVITNLPAEPKVIAVYTSSDYFSLFKVPMVLGQAFSPSLPYDQAIDSVVISEKFWQQHFNRDPNVLGKTITDVKSSYKIIGVVSKDFEPPYMFYSGEGDIWLNFGYDRRFFNSGEWDNPWDNTYRSLKLVGIAKENISQAEIFNDLDNSIENIRAEWLEGYENATDFRPLVIPYRIAELGNKDHLSLFLLAGTVGLLLIAIINVCNLFFSRALSQHKTLALQAVLGAKRRLLFNAIFAQTLILMSFSIAIALFLSAWGIKLFKHLAQGKMPLVQSIAIDFNLLVIALVLTLVLAYLFALVTSGLINYKALKSQLQSSGKGGVNQVSSRTVKFLISLQMGLASILIIFACFVLAKTHQTINRSLGSKVENMTVVSAYILDENKNLSMTERYEKRQRMQQAFAKRAEVKRVSIGRSPVNLQVTRATLTSMQGKQTDFLPQGWVGQDYFDHTELKIIKGRTFSDAAMRGEKNEILVTTSLAYQLEPNGDVIGKVYDGHNPKNEIVGITADFNHPNYYAQDKGAHIWWPNIPNSYSFIIETKTAAPLDQASILLAFRELDSRFKIWEFRSLEQEYRRILYMDTITLFVSYILAVFTLLLASVGIYGVLSYNLGLKRFEFGLRMALGAKKKRLYNSLIKEAIIPLMIGLFGAIVLTALLYLQFQQRLIDWLTFDWLVALPALSFTLVIAIWASFRPLQKIIKKQPMNALRNE